MAFINFVVAGYGKDMSFMNRDPAEGDHDVGSPSVSVNNDLLEVVAVESLASAEPIQLTEKCCGL